MSGDLHGLQVIATPAGKTSINADDMLVLDLPVPGVGSSGAAETTVDPALLDHGPAAFSVSPAVMTHRSRASVRSVDNDGSGGGIPLKARPTTDAVKDIGDCKGLNSKCISDYFDNMEKGFKKSWDDLMNRNMLASDGFLVQSRLSPYGKSTKLSIVTAVAVEIDGHRLSVRMDREPLIRLDGKPVSLEEAQLGFKVGKAEALLFASDLSIRTPDGGPAVVLPGVTGGATDVLVDPGNAENWTGLLGDHDSDRENDLRPRDGEPLAAEWSTEDLYEVFAESWRISDADSLFDYEEGESTATFTDQNHPSEHVDISSLTEAERAVADTVCRAAGLIVGPGLENCVFDYAMTGNMEFVRTARSFQALVNGSAGHVLVPVGTEDGGLLIALDIDGGNQVWQQEISKSPCLAVTASGQVVVPVPGEEERIALAVLDPASGRQIATAPTGLWSCSSMTVVGDTVVVRHGNTVLGIDVVAPEVRFELEIPGLYGALVVSGDGMIWVLRKVDDQVHAEWIDPEDGRPTRVALPVSNVLENVAATPDGIVVGFGGGLLRLDASGARWQTPFPITFAGNEISQLPSGPLSVSAEHVASHLGDEVGIFDLTTGKPIQVVRPSSFSNNGDQQFLLGGVVVVGPFGGKHWVEAWDLANAKLQWSADTPTVKGFNDVKRIGPSTPAGLVAVAGSSDEGVVVSLVGPAG